MKNSDIVGKFIIVNDLTFTDFMKDEDDNLIVYDTMDEALETCGMYEFEDAIVLEVKYNHLDAEHGQSSIPNTYIGHIEDFVGGDIYVRLKREGDTDLELVKPWSSLKNVPLDEIVEGRMVEWNRDTGDLTLPHVEPFTKEEIAEAEEKSKTLFDGLNIDLPKYLVRPSDFNIYELDDSNNCYRFYKGYTYPDGTRQNAQRNHTFANLTENHSFFPIEGSQIPEYEEKCDKHYKFVGWQCRPDGHGGSKGGTLEEYELYLKRVEEYQQKPKS